MGPMFISYHFSRNIAFHAYAIIIFMRIVGKINMDPISMHIIRREILRWIRIWSQILIPPTHSREKTVLKILRGRIPKIFASLNQKLNFKSYDVYIAYVMSHMWVIEPFFKKWVIAHYSRIRLNFENPNPYQNPLDNTEVIYGKKIRKNSVQVPKKWSHIFWYLKLWNMIITWPDHVAPWSSVLWV